MDIHVIRINRSSFKIIVDFFPRYITWVLFCGTAGIQAS